METLQITLEFIQMTERLASSPSSHDPRQLLREREKFYNILQNSD